MHQHTLIPFVPATPQRPATSVTASRWASVAALTAALAFNASAEPTKLAVPSTAQYAWHEQERLMFVHFGPVTWEGAEVDTDGKTDLSKMNPEGFDANAICEVAKSWGAKQILLVCKHVGGFCWWPSETTEYDVAGIPWKGGQGNVVKEVADACRKHGLSMGVYIYPDEPRFAKQFGRGGVTDDPKKQEEWNRLFRKQWEEVLTICGPELVREVWFDGGCKIPVQDLFDRLAPNAVIFQGGHATIRWVGNERGLADNPNWNTLKRADLKTGVATQKHSNPDGDAWAPVECDTTLYDHFWAWSPAKEAKRKSLDTLMRTYVQSVGRGSVLLLNSTPRTDGRIPEGDVARYREFGEAIERNFGHPLATGATAELDLGGVKKFNCADLWEDYRHGHRIRAYVIEGRVNGNWKQLAAGTAVGRRKLDMFPTIEADRVRVRVTQSVGEPVIRRFQVHQVDDALARAFQSVSDVWRKVGSWKAGNAEVRLNLTAATVEPRLYTVRLTGKATLQSVEYWIGGEKVAADQVRRISGNAMEINRSQVLPPGTLVEMRFKIQATAGTQGGIELQ